MKAGVGYSSEESSFAAGVQAVRCALEKGGITRPDLLMAFCGGQIDPVDFLKGIQSVAGTDMPVIGGSAIGVITNDRLSYAGGESGVAALTLEGVPFEIAWASLTENIALCAGVLVENYTASFDRSAFLFFYDSLKKAATDLSPPEMSPSPLLIEGFERGLGTELPIFGAGLLGDFQFRGIPSQFCGSFAAPGHLVGLLLGRGLKLYGRIMHGCTPLDGIYHRITRSEEAVVYEIDGRPAVSLIDALYDHQDWHHKHPVDLLTIGVNHGQKFAPFDEAAYVNRLITGVLPDGSGIGLFEPDLAPGTEIQFMLRDGAKMIESASENVAALIARIAEDKGVARFGLYIDCAGRTAALSNTPTEEAAEVQSVLNRHGIPLLGFYSGVEVAPCPNRSRALDWTGVLMIFAEEER